MAKLNTIEGIGEAYMAKLEAAGITSVEGLLEACATKKGRVAVAEKTEITEKLVLRWANQADLSRIKGVGGEYAELLEAAGVDTVPSWPAEKPRISSRKCRKSTKPSRWSASCPRRHRWPTGWHRPVPCPVYCNTDALGL
jgi:predicted RecB family nuclease